MKYILTEQQNDKMVERLTNGIKSDGWVNTAKLVGGYENLIKILGITSPMEFLHLYDNLNVVQSEEDPELTLFRYNKRNNLIVLDIKHDTIFFNKKIWSILEFVFGLKYSEIQKLVKEWLNEVYNLRGVTPTPIIHGWRIELD